MPAVVAPAATVAEAEKLSKSVGFAATVSSVPPAGAGLEMVAVQVLELDGVRVVLAQDRDETVIGAMTERVTLALEDPSVATTFAVLSDVTAAAVATNVAVVADAGTVTEAGTETTEVTLLERVTLEPPAGAALESVTVQVVVEEAGRLVPAHCRELSVTMVSAVTVIVTGLLVPLREDVITEVWSEETAAAVAVKVAEEAAAGTVTEEGTVNTEVTLLERATLEPPAGAALESVMVQVVVDDADTVVLVHCRELSEGGSADTVIVTGLLVPFKEAVLLEV